MFHTSWLLPLTILHNFYVHSVAISLLKKLKWILCYQNFLHWQIRMPMTIYHWKCPFEILQGLFWRCGCNFKYLRQISLECTKIIKIGSYLTVSQKCRWIFFYETVYNDCYHCCFLQALFQLLFRTRHTKFLLVVFQVTWMRTRYRQHSEFVALVVVFLFLSHSV